MSDSKELPVIDRAIDNTAQSSYMKCPREFKLAMLDGWRPKEKSQALSFGAFWHKLLEVHYRTGGDDGAMLDTFTEYQAMVPDTGDYRTASRAFVEYKKYLKKYPPAIDCRETVGFPHSPMVEISTAVYNEILGNEYAGKLDRIVQINSEQAVVEDHKTTSRKDKYYFQQFEQSNQMMGYTWIGKQLVTDLEIIGVRINLLHCLTSKSEFERHIVQFSDSRIKEWEENTAMWYRRMQRSIAEDDFPAHFGDNGCIARFGKCKFFGVCSSNPMIRQAVLEQDFVVDHWDPLATED